PPGGAPSSQSIVKAKDPCWAWSSRALPMSFSLPAKGAHEGTTGDGFSPSNSAFWGRVVVGRDDGPAAVASPLAVRLPFAFPVPGVIGKEPGTGAGTGSGTRSPQCKPLNTGPVSVKSPPRRHPVTGVVY